MLESVIFSLPNGILVSIVLVVVYLCMICCPVGMNQKRICCFRPLRATVTTATARRVLFVALLLKGSLGELVHTMAGSFSEGLNRSTAGLSDIASIALDTSGNYYVGEQSTGRILFVSVNDNSMITYAGGGASNEDGAIGTSISIVLIYGLTSDTLGKIYYSESAGCRVRVLSTSKVVTTIAGVYGVCAYNGNGLAGTSTHLNPRGLHLDPVDNKMYIADVANQVVRVVDMSSAQFTTTIFAGNATFGGFVDHVSATTSKLSGPLDVWGSTLHDIFIAENTNCRVRKVTKSTGQIDTVAGNGCGASTGTVATSSNFGNLFALCGDNSGNFYFSQYGYVWKVSSGGTFWMLAGSASVSTPPIPGIAATNARIGYPFGCKVDISGNLFIADHHVVWKLNPSAIPGTIITSVGGFTNNMVVPATSIRFHQIYGMWGNTAGSIFVCDQLTQRVYEVANGLVSAYAGRALPTLELTASRPLYPDFTIRLVLRGIALGTFTSLIPHFIAFEKSPSQQKSSQRLLAQSQPVATLPLLSMLDLLRQQICVAHLG